MIKKVMICGMISVLVVAAAVCGMGRRDKSPRAEQQSQTAESVASAIPAELESIKAELESRGLTCAIGVGMSNDERVAHRVAGTDARIKFADVTEQETHSGVRVCASAVRYDRANERFVVYSLVTDGDSDLCDK